MKKAIAMVLTASMAVASLAGCGSSSSKTTTTSSVVTETGSGATAATSGAAAASNSDMKVAMITDYGDITDQSFNQTTYEACKAFCKDNSLEFTYYKPDGNNDSDREAMVDKAVSDGYNVIVMPGYAFAQCLVDESPMYPDVKFIA
ncbi:MAG: BMP family protein, partial [Chordicoccus sp.]